MSPQAKTALQDIAKACDTITAATDLLRHELDPTDITDIKTGLIYIRPVTHNPHPLPIPRTLFDYKCRAANDH
jgi:hypothetical protein